jgi:SAM-dependent methyltransferase
MKHPPDDQLSAHYGQDGLLARIENALAAMGKSPATVTADDLAPADEFHIGGREASAAFLDRLGLSPSQHLLDIGCGIGGGARFAAARYGVRVTGIDLTADFVETGLALNRWCGLDGEVALEQGSALATPFAGGSFDGAYMMHVGMNIADKSALFAEVFRVLRAGAVFGIYDIMRMEDGDLVLPVPWASAPEESFVASPATYRQALEAAGFSVEAERNRHAFALDFFDRVRARNAASGGPPPLGLQIIMGDTAALKLKNMVANVAAGRVAPFEMIARKPA